MSSKSSEHEKTKRRLLRYLAHETKATEDKIDNILVGADRLVSIEHIDRDAPRRMRSSRARSVTLIKEVGSLRTALRSHSKDPYVARRLAPYEARVQGELRDLSMALRHSIDYIDRHLSHWPKNVRDVRGHLVADEVAFLFWALGKKLSTYRDAGEDEDCPVEGTFGFAVQGVFDLLGIKSHWRRPAEIAAKRYRYQDFSTPLE